MNLPEELPRTSLPPPVLRSRFLLGLLPILVWLGVGFSLGWYYTFTYYGRHGWPMPVPEPCAGIVLYYFSVLNVETEIQAVHWMLAFVAAGYLWPLALSATGRLFGDRTVPAFSQSAAAFAMAALPLALPGPLMAYFAAATPDGFDVSHMFAVALRRANVNPWSWLTPLYFGLGLLNLGLQLRVFRRLYPLQLNRAILRYPVAWITIIVFASLGGAIVGVPLRWLLE